MPRALITGAGGFVGPYLARHLHELGTDVVGTVLRHSPAQNPHMALLPLDIRERAWVSALIRDVAPDEIYHLAALSQPNLSNDDAYWDVNLTGTRNVLDVARDVNAKVLVVDSAYVYGARSASAHEDVSLRPVNAYGASKAAAEMAALAASNRGTYAIVARAFNHTGPGQPTNYFVPTLVQQLKAIEIGMAQPVLHLGDLTSTRDIADVRDIVRAYPALLRQGTSGQAYNVGTGEGTTMRRVVDIATSLMNCDITIVQDQARLRPNDLPYLVADTTKLHATIDWRPEHDLSTTLFEMLRAARPT